MTLICNGCWVQEFTKDTFSSLHRSSKLLTTLVMHTSYSENLSRESEHGKDHCTSLRTFMVWDIADVLESVQHWVFPTCDWETFQRALHLPKKLKAHFNHMTHLNMAVSTYCVHKLYSYISYISIAAGMFHTQLGETSSHCKLVSPSCVWNMLAAINCIEIYMDGDIDKATSSTDYISSHNLISIYRIFSWKQPSLFAFCRTHSLSQYYVYTLLQLKQSFCHRSLLFMDNSKLQKTTCWKQWTLCST